ncbi:protein GAMETE EXPRESSED 1-like [Amaranthus tricolor]|uniref:protein GAMETE EXPRESSED 1-like n=1 Tax=Amaranthus tricolor TaxID=29722 RepID=UPI00258B27D4|nr:protein GAMETE EXPRESSED 1-like [Amaranthus tricolor]
MRACIIYNNANYFILLQVKLKIMWNQNLLFLLIFLTISQTSQSWGLFSSSSNADSSQNQPKNKDKSQGLVAEFSVDAMNDPKAAELLENAKRKLGGMNPCWFRSYQQLFSTCSEIFAAEENRKRLAWHLSDCFQKDTGRNSFPSCSGKSAMVDCLRKLNNDDHKTYLEFYLQTNSICHQLQSKAFKSQLEGLVNDLKDSALIAEDKLNIIEEKSDNLLHNSNEIQESITSINTQTQVVVETLKNMFGYMGVLLNHSKEINETANDIAISQVELLEGQGRLKEKLEEDMFRIQESYNNLGEEIANLQKKTVDVKHGLNKVGEEMFLQVQNLQGKTDDITEMAKISVDKQQELLQGQSKAIEGLQSLTTFLSQALQESRVNLEQLVDFANGQHEELLKQQKQLLQANDHLANNSKSILAAQEAFESKQANMFAAIDKLFALQNAMLLESRLIKAFFVYSILILVLYLLTSTKQTYSVRCRLYIGLCIAFAIECAILRFTTNDVEQHIDLRSLVKPLFGSLVLIQLIYTIYTYRDIETLNHKMLVSLLEKVNGMHKGDRFSWDDDEDDVDSEVDWLSWIEAELPEDIGFKDDPDYMLPDTGEEVGENSVVLSTERRYNLRCRS